MPVDKKSAGDRPRQEDDQSALKGERQKVQAKAPDQDVLPGILGKQLRAAYGELLNSPIPDAFSDLIKQLEGREPGRDPGEPAAKAEPSETTKTSAPSKDGGQ